MASSNLISCFLLVLVLLHSKHSTALTPQGDKDSEAVNVEARDRMNLLKSNKVIGAGLDVEVSNKKLKGRKMMTKETKEQSLEEEKERQITGASFVVGNCKHRRNYGKCKKMSGRIRSHDPLKEKMVGFTAFSADYHLPHSHPPRHN